MNPLHRIQRQPDVVEHTMIAAAKRGPIFRVVRLVKRGPLVPFGLMYVESRMEPGTDNDMTGTRSPSLAGFLSGEPVPHDELPRLFASGKAGSRHIGQAEYARLVAELASNRRAGRYDPRFRPYEAVDVNQITIPFGA